MLLEKIVKDANRLKCDDAAHWINKYFRFKMRSMLKHNLE